MQLSIIIPAYNAEKYLDECLVSCYRQDMPECDYELIIINDGSDDGTLAKAQEWADKHSNIKIISQENKGQAIILQMFYGKTSGKAYLQLFEYVPYQYVPCSEVYEYEISKIAYLLK